MYNEETVNRNYRFVVLKKMSDAPNMNNLSRPTTNNAETSYYISTWSYNLRRNGEGNE